MLTEPLPSDAVKPNVETPTSLVVGVPDRVRVDPSSLNHRGGSAREYEILGALEVNVESEKMNSNPSETLATGGTWELMGKVIVGVEKDIWMNTRITARMAMLPSCHSRFRKFPFSRKNNKVQMIYEAAVRQSASPMSSNIGGKERSNRAVEGVIYPGHRSALGSPFIAIMSFKGWREPRLAKSLERQQDETMRGKGLQEFDRSPSQPQPV